MLLLVAGHETTVNLGAANRAPAALARMEGEIAYHALLDHFARIELNGTPVRRPTFTLRGLESLPVALTAAS